MFSQTRRLNIPTAFLNLESVDKSIGKSGKNTRNVSIQETRNKHKKNKLDHSSWDLEHTSDLITGKTLDSKSVIIIKGENVSPFLHF